MDAILPAAETFQKVSSALVEREKNYSLLIVFIKKIFSIVFDRMKFPVELAMEIRLDFPNGCSVTEALIGDEGKFKATIPSQLKNGDIVDFCEIS
ncbi:hypothetical protein TNIN_412231 [Trichonephila inaurata madagascariensis]|uniref:Uncharacterized protein n=1 Tax=Trichonephila inaurata madagascariensis TaxID=2747483 RepID=A0A8X7CFP8_9ARAC|nr:hypothetical protein TNIN_412231 [Trichonephila inaurata madagascariensis]